VTGPHGRTDTQGVGSAGQSASGGAAATGGWHGKSRIEKTILAHQEAFASANAASVAELVGRDDLLIVAGPDEPRSDLLRQLPSTFDAPIVEAPALEANLSDADLVALATDAAIEHQSALAARQVARWRSGNLGSRAIAGIDAVRRAIQRGQLETLILSEDAVPHLGTAFDTREQPGEMELAVADELLRGASGVSAEYSFARGGLPEGTSGVIGTLRWV
jgi:hypothetical protein